MTNMRNQNAATCGGLFGWLAAAPWSNPGFSGFFLSLVIFGFGGGITGVVLGTQQINIMAHNTLRIPGHFHVTVVGGTAPAFTAVTYYIMPLIFQREIRFPRLAKWQPYLFGLGVGGISLFMMGAGTLGVSRRHWDITFADSALDFSYPEAAFLMLALNGLSAIAAATGGLMYIVIVVGSVFFGRKVEGSVDGWTWHDAAGDQVELHFERGRLARWSLSRANPG